MSTSTPRRSSPDRLECASSTHRLDSKVGTEVALMKRRDGSGGSGQVPVVDLGANPARSRYHCTGWDCTPHRWVSVYVVHSV